jgi:hypothetical protein
VLPLPVFHDDGLLPAGDYELTLDELRASALVSGNGVGSSTWDAQWRAHLVQSLATLVRQLWQVGVRDIFADGSFVEDKDHPNDIDGYFVCDLKTFASGELQRQLNLLDPHKVWTWDPTERRAFRGYPKKQLPMWHSVSRRALPALWAVLWDPRFVRQRARVSLGISPLP